MNGFKVFNPDWTCRGFQYEVGKTYDYNISPEVCNQGFHFCEKAADCFRYYSFDTANKVAEIIAHGDIAKGDNKCATNKIEIVREIPWAELLELVNTGKADTGLCNSGNRNSGDCNSGDWNSGNRNSGNRNSGNRNSGNRNSGDWNSGDWNSGNRNSGDWNSGDWNSGDWNSGNRNSGDWNSGNRNSGDWNSGDWNSGNRNSGNRNSGNRNSGDWNKTSFVAGCFNTQKHDLLFFDKPTSMTFEEWRRSDACKIMNRVDFRPADWIWENQMNDDEKAAHPEASTTGGYLKIRDNSECFREWWGGLSNREKEVIKKIPNFDPNKFKVITGIEV